MSPPLRQSEFGYPPYYPEPAPADYSDEVGDEVLAALEARVAKEMEEEEWELVDGPGW